LQSATLARGTVSGIFLSNSTAGLISVANSVGIFKSDQEVSGANSSTTANVVSLAIDVGVVDINNTFTIQSGNRINTTSFVGTVTLISNGSGANVVFSNNLINTEDITLVSDLIEPFLELELNTTWPFLGEPNANLNTIIAD